VKTKKRTEVTIEVDEVIIRRSKETTVAWCGPCAENVRMLEANEAALAAGVSSRAIYREVEAGRLHFVEVEGGSILVCQNSLSRVAPAQFAQSDPRPPDSGIDSVVPVIDIAATAEE
jgi:hypothetical protein